MPWCTHGGQLSGADSLHCAEVEFLDTSAVLRVSGNSPVSASHLHLPFFLNVGLKKSSGFYESVCTHRAALLPSPFMTYVMKILKFYLYILSQASTFFLSLK